MSDHSRKHNPELKYFSLETKREAHSLMPQTAQMTV